MGRLSRRVPLALLCVIATGCARNAALDVQLELPPGTGIARVEFERFGASFNAPWTQSHDVALMPGSQQPTLFTILTDDPGPTVLVNVRFCQSTAACDRTPDGPSVRYELQSPFYLGHRTTWNYRLLCTPAAEATTTTTIDRCEIGGCVTVAPGTDMPVSFCRADGTHFCEPPTNAVVPDAGPTVVPHDTGLCQVMSFLDAGPSPDAGPIVDATIRGDQ